MRSDESAPMQSDGQESTTNSVCRLPETLPLDSAGETHTKRCSKCGVEKPRTEFSRDRQKKDGLRYECKPCDSRRSAQHHRSNRERRIQYQRKWYVANKKRIAEQRATPEYRARTLFHDARRRAKKAGLPITIDADWILERLDRGCCEASNLPFSFDSSGFKHQNPLSPTVDRIDPDRGYTKDNSQVVVCMLNLAKGSWGFGAVVALAHALVRRFP